MSVDTRSETAADQEKGNEADKNEPHGPSFGRELLTICHRARQMWDLIPPRQRWLLGGAVVLMALGSFSNTAIALLLGTLVDSVQGVHAETASETPLVFGLLPASVMTFLTLIGIVYLVREGLQVARRYLVEDMSTRLEQHLFLTLVSHLFMADLASLSQEKIGALHGRIARNVAGSVKFLRVGFLDFFPALLTGGFALATAVTRQPWMGLVMAGVVPISLAITLKQLVSQKGVRLELLRNQEEMDGTVVEQLSGIDFIRAVNTHEREIDRLAQAAEIRRSKELHHNFVMSLYGSSKALCEGAFHIAVLALAVYMAVKGTISIGDILTFSMLFLNVMAPLNEVHRVIDEGHESSLLVADLLEMVAEPPDRSYQTEAREPELNGEGFIKIDNMRVHLAPEETRKPALEDVSLNIRRGEIIGIAGRSGCGKSTLLRALLRLVHPSSGESSLGGVPLESVSRECIARLAGYVGQSPFVFAASIEDNISYEHEDATDEEIQHAAQLAGLDDEILQMPGGYKTLVAERGQNLSGGQKQRLALARMFLKNPPLLILDEATSALDAISEQHIQKSLAADRGGRTVILVAHRLSTLLHTDRIIVFDQGRIAETGAYQDLVDRGGVFAELVRSAEAPLV
jgi:ATP-binding cassette subfamily B protein